MGEAMLNRELQGVSKPRRSLSVGLARNENEIVEAQRLRYAVFAGEMGAHIETGRPGVDHDRFDAHCEHLLVRDAETNEVVGTYRILPPRNADRIGSYYSEQEFDLARLAHLRHNLVEVGRSCIRSDYRSGGTILLLWAGLARYMMENHYEHMIGCASLSMGDGGHAAASIYRRIKERHLCPLEYRAFPRCPLPLERLDASRQADLPPLVKGYLNVGAWICGEPAWDPDFNVADLLILLPLANVNARYTQHFLAQAA